MFLVPYLRDPPRMCATNIGLCIYLLTLVDFGLLYYYLFVHFISFFFKSCTPQFIPFNSGILEYILRSIPFNSRLRYTGVYSPLYSVYFRYTPLYWSIFSVVFRLTPVYSVILEYILRCNPFNSGILRYTGVYSPL